MPDILPETPPLALSPLEKRAIALVGCGIRNKDIALILGLSESVVSRRISKPVTELECDNVAVLVVNVINAYPSIMQGSSSPAEEEAFRRYTSVRERMKAEPLTPNEVAYLKREVTRYTVALSNEWQAYRPPPLARQIIERLKVPRVSNLLLLIVAAAAELGQLRADEFRTGYVESVQLEEAGLTISVTGEPGAHVTILYNGRAIYLGVPIAEK
jgi:hypothetical protein